MRLAPGLYLLKKQILQYNLEAKKLLLLVSGGKDSMALLSAFVGLKEHLNLNLSVLHIHHGEDINSDFRKQAKVLVQKTCDKVKIDFFCNETLPTGLDSEEKMRNYRQQVCAEYVKEGRVLVTAHHPKDQLETRIMRLIRGCGIEGLIAMQVFDSKYFRPLINWQKLDLDALYANKDFEFIEDPTNAENLYFRNWLRQVWLPQLEKEERGSLDRLSMSLDNIAAAWSDEKNNLMLWFNGDELNRKFLLNLDFSHQLQVLSLFLRQNAIFNYQRGQLEELLKRLDSRQKSYTLEMMNCTWQVSETKIKLLLRA